MSERSPPQPIGRVKMTRELFEGHAGFISGVPTSDYWLGGIGQGYRILMCPMGQPHHRIDFVSPLHAEKRSWLPLLKWASSSRWTQEEQVALIACSVGLVARRCSIEGI